jgi:hypothetical protein
MALTAAAALAAIMATTSPAAPPPLVAVVGAAAGAYPVTLSIRYLPWGHPAPRRPAGTQLMVEISLSGDRRKPSFPAIAHGAGGPWLRQLSRELPAGTLLSFAPEANAWGHRQPVSAAAYRAAYRTVQAEMGHRLVYVWQVSRWLTTTWTLPLAQMRPAGVSFVGVDGYYGAGNSYGTVFGPVLSALRRITRLPVFIAEAGIPPLPAPQRAALLSALIAGARRSDLRGVTYFDEGRWRVTATSATALSAALRSWESSR